MRSSLPKAPDPAVYGPSQRIPFRLRLALLKRSRPAQLPQAILVEDQDARLSLGKGGGIHDLDITLDIIQILIAVIAQ